MSAIKRAAIVVAAILIAGEASALDMCFEGGAQFFVAKSYRRPPKGTCRPLTGYEASTSVPFAANGTACLNVSGDTLYVQWVAIVGAGRVFIVRMTLPHPSLTGGESLFSNIRETGTVVNVTGGRAFKCKPPPIP